MARKIIVAIDLGGTNLKLALLNLKYKIIDRRVLFTKRFRKKEDLIYIIIDSINKLIKDNHFKIKDILGVGLGLPGPIDIKRGIVHFFPNLPGWRKVNLKNILKQRLGLPIFLDNDAHLAAIAEHKIGAARGLNNAVCLTLGTGVGGGIILEGKLYRGRSFAAGEIGHIPINERGPACNCGGIACLETYVGNRRILKAAKKLFKRKITLEELSALAKNGNQQALKLWSKIGTSLGIALTGVVNLLNLDGIVIGGGVANAGKMLFAQIKRVILTRAMCVQARQVKVFKAKLGKDAGLIGAAILVKEGVRR